MQGRDALHRKTDRRNGARLRMPPGSGRQRGPTTQPLDRGTGDGTSVPRTVRQSHSSGAARRAVHRWSRWHAELQDVGRENMRKRMRQNGNTERRPPPGGSLQKRMRIPAGSSYPELGSDGVQGRLRPLRQVPRTITLTSPPPLPKKSLLAPPPQGYQTDKNSTKNWLRHYAGIMPNTRKPQTRKAQ